jgi:hypothetical protein
MFSEEPELILSDQGTESSGQEGDGELDSEYGPSVENGVTPDYVIVAPPDDDDDDDEGGGDDDDDDSC